MKYIIILALFFFACATNNVQEKSIKNAFIEPQMYFIIAPTNIDSIMNYAEPDYDTLIKTGKRKMITYNKPDPMQGVYQYKYLAFIDNKYPILSIYSETELSGGVEVKLQKVADSKTVNCMVNDISCWCLFE